MSERKKKLSKSDPEYAARLNELLNDPERQAKAAQRREDLDQLLNSPMRWYHKLPYWIVLGLIGYGIGKLFGLV
jgi:hypothetical protein